MRQSHLRVFDESDDISRALILLGSALESAGVDPIELIVVGGAALNVLGLAFRPTRDVDVVGLAGTGGAAFCVSSRPFPEALAAAAQEVARALGLPADWLNPGPTDLLERGLPGGFESRVVRREYGPRLAVFYAGRVDLIALKVYAATDGGPRSRHTSDLVALKPTTEELAWAADWARQHDDSEAFARDLEALVRHVSANVENGELNV